MDYIIYHPRSNIAHLWQGKTILTTKRLLGGNCVLSRANIHVLVFGEEWGFINMFYSSGISGIHEPFLQEEPVMQIAKWFELMNGGLVDFFYYFFQVVILSIPIFTYFTYPTFLLPRPNPIPQDPGSPNHAASGNPRWTLRCLNRFLKHRWLKPSCLICIF